VKLFSGRNQYGNPIEIEPEILWGLYCGEEHTIREIAEIFECSRCAIRRNLLKYEVPLRNNHEHLIGRIPWNKDKKTGPLSDEIREKISNKLKGRMPTPMTEETRRKISETKRKQYANGEVTIWNKNIPCSDETKKKISEANKGNPGYWTGIPRPDISGENHFNWKDGATSTNILIRNSMKYKEWHRNILERDNFVCQHCGVVGGTLHAHHTFPFADILRFWDIKSLDDAYACRELWNLDNGITLCKKCHMKIHKWNRIYTATITFEDVKT